MKKTIIAVILVISLLALSLTACTLPEKPEDENDLAAQSAAVFTLDLNPGVRIYVKDDNTVIDIEATNEDGEEIVASLTLEGVNYEEAIDEIVDAFCEGGYAEGESSSILISIEKDTLNDISERVNAEIEAAFEKHGKLASIIEHKFEDLDDKLEEEIEKISRDYGISEGKAYLIEQIRNEKPELSPEELSELAVGELRELLDDTSEDVKGKFDKIGEAIKDRFVGREAALAAALASLEINAEDVEMCRVKVDREDGKMVYEVEFVYNGMAYEIEVDAESGEILESESEEFVEFDPEGAFDDFCDKYELELEDFLQYILSLVIGEGGFGREAITRAEMLEEILEKLDIDEDALVSTDIEIHDSRNGKVYSVTLELESGDVYEVVAEARSGMPVRITLNGEEIEISAHIKDFPFPKPGEGGFPGNLFPGFDGNGGAPEAGGDNAESGADTPVTDGGAEAESSEAA